MKRKHAPLPKVIEQDDPPIIPRALLIITLTAIAVGWVLWLLPN
jgi:hypothetical protein